ncbi:MAG TPA: molybdopterin cofactor-binding domain-containing protein [Xanthobacteraceae bacterium]|nr:molybdopterin cofactor-binding domain-containing protein [Xanthobacteraceae bacterium]
MNTPVLTRRAFTAAAGAIVLAFTLDPKRALAEGAKLPGDLQKDPRLDAWIRIDADGSATVFTGKAELGQGIVTALTQIAAEELDLPLDRVHMITADTARTPDEGVTAGSQSVEYSGTALRFAGAEVRAILLDAAAKKLAVAADTLTVSAGTISAADGRKMTYGELAAAVDLKRDATAKFRPKPASAHTIVGTAVKRVDIPRKVTGGVAYVQDMRPAGMLHGRVVRPPRYGSKLDSVDEAAAKTTPGVVAVVRDGSFLGVVAAREEQAIAARAALTKSAKWTLGPPLPDPATIHEHLLSLPTEDTIISDKRPQRLASLPPGAQVMEATYRRPYMAHASIGPSCSLAEFKDGKLTIWSHSQGVFPNRGKVAEALGMNVADVREIHTEGSGCYGHNGADDVALDAALLARAVPGRPVRVQWMRDDEFGWEPYGAAMVMKAKATLHEGRVLDWNYDVWSNTHSMRPSEPGGVNLLAAWDLADAKKPAPPRNIPQPAGGGDRNAIPLYDFPRQHVVNHLIKEMPLRVSALRTLGAYANVFALESFMDELALAAGADPVAFRLAHLTDPRAKAVIEAAAKRAGWKPGEQGGNGRGRGIGFAKYKNLASYVAVIAEVEVDRGSGAVRVPSAFAAVDSGQIINPDGLANQVEGGVIQSTSWTLKEEVRFTPDGIVSRDWESYAILTMPEVPHVEVELIDRPDERPLGAGECSQGPTVAAIANAVAHATGRRLRDLPLTPARVKAALG